MNKSPSAEYDLISRLQDVLGNQQAGDWKLLIGDDAAVRRCGDSELIITTDISVENVHFSRAYMSLEEIGYRAMVANLSDCAAMGAIPDGALVQLVFPSQEKEIIRAAEQIYRGFAMACGTWNFPLVGGDISAGRQWVLGITLLGRVPSGGRVLKRKGALKGDCLWVTGLCGASAAGLQALRKWKRCEVPDRYKRFLVSHIKPLPRVEAGLELAACQEVHAMMDLTDGLSKDCGTLACENNLGIILNPDPAQIPEEMIQLSDELGVSWLEWFLHGGEDYHLLFAATPQFDPSKMKDCTGVMKIGYFTEDVSGVMLQSGDERTVVPPGGYDHLKSEII